MGKSRNPLPSSPAAAEQQKKFKTRKLNRSECPKLLPGEENTIGIEAASVRRMISIEGGRLFVDLPLYRDAVDTGQKAHFLPRDPEKDLISQSSTDAKEPQKVVNCRPDDYQKGSTSDKQGQRSGSKGSVFDTTLLDFDIVELIETLTGIFDNSALWTSTC
ncbi:hypothetical protein R1flu_009465 [Riccia fluitans]|uniref:Uncharacterized protein n=1 Tax=Riccia fluitans TaxID=41844 RepID=A0ABD1Z267_9MARC